MSNFRLNSKTVFLTYPHTEFDPFELYDFINDRKPLSFFGCVKETHEDGSPHMHALIKFKTKVDIRDQKWFDHSGKHPNIGPVRNWTASLAYIKKEGEPIIIAEDNGNQ